MLDETCPVDGLIDEEMMIDYSNKPLKKKTIEHDEQSRDVRRNTNDSKAKKNELYKNKSSVIMNSLLYVCDDVEI